MPHRARDLRVSSPPTLAAMRAEVIDERHLRRERDGADFVVFIYTGAEARNTSWSVSSYLITDADLPEVLRWLAEMMPTDSEVALDSGAVTCWSLGLVRDPAQPTTASDVEVAWIVGSDVLNRDPAHLSSDEQRIADEMLARRHHVAML